MKLGMISYCDRQKLSLDEFRKIAERGLSFVEFCVNVGEEATSFAEKIPLIKEGMEKYNLETGSIGRWGSDRINAEGKPNEAELANDLKLIDIANELGCGVYNVGCNYVNTLSLYDNATAAIGYFDLLIQHAKPYGIHIAVYNCDWNNFVNCDAMWELVLGHLPDLWIKYDSSHSIYAGRDYLSEMRKWGKRFGHLHIKGSLNIDGTRFDDPPAGLDATDWHAFFGVLYAVGYNGTLSLEPHSAIWKEELGDQGLDYSIQYIKQFIMPCVK